MELFSDLSVSAQTNFAELVEQTQAAMLDRSIMDLPGSFNKKEVKGTVYWYWQVRDLSGNLKQAYLGPDDERLRSLIQRRQEGKSPAAGNLARLAGACVSLGCMTLVPQHFKVINRLSEQGFFSAGGLLVGTHAFIAMANMLGVRWGGSSWRTNDIDFAHAGKNVSLALPTTMEANVHDAITSLEMGLLPPTSITAGPAATYLTTKHDLRVDLLTVSGRSDNVYKHGPLNVNLQPLKFMEFSLEGTTQTAVISGELAVMVNIPSPMRYALHKLLVMAEREDKFRMKIEKDAHQVAALVSFGLARSPYALKQAADDIMERGKDWRTRIVQGLGYLASYHPDLSTALSSVLNVRSPKPAACPR